MVVDQLLAPYTQEQATKPFDFATFKDEQFNRLAALIRENVDMPQIYAALNS